MFSYRMSGTCATKVELEIKEGVITACRFTNGCTGNTSGVAKLAIGRKAEEVAKLLKGTVCRGGTSCPDQLAKAIEAYHE